MSARVRAAARRAGRDAPRERRGRGAVDTDVVATEKLQKALADLGLGSRREIERWITAGRVSVNGAVAKLGARVSQGDRISVDDVEQRSPHAGASGPAGGPRVILMNKAEGVICTRRDPEGRPTCFDRLPRLTRGRWIAVGRLDINSSGLLLFANDGRLAHALMHPSTGLTREYAVRVDRELDLETQAVLTEGVLLPDGDLARFAELTHVGGSGRNHWYRVVLEEGRNREVRSLFESQGIRVSRLKRVRYGPIVLPASIKRGRFDALSQQDVASLYAHVGLPVPRTLDAGRSRKSRTPGSKPHVSVLARSRSEGEPGPVGGRARERGRPSHGRDARSRRR